MRNRIISSAAGIFLLLSLIVCCKNTEKKDTDVLVIGGTTSGVSAGIQSARLGVRTIIVEETAWLGGMMTAGGVSGIDGNHFLHSGIWNEFRNRLRARYGGAANLSTGWVSNTLFEPHTGDSIFKTMAAETPDLEIIYGYHITGIMKEKSRVTGAVFENGKNCKLSIKAKVVIDATDLGDGLSLAGAGYDLGMESRSATGEASAPDVSNNILQDLTWVAILKDYGKGVDKTIKKPDGYNPEIYRGSCSMTVDSILIDCEKMLTYGKLPNNKYMINWPRKGNDIYLNIVEMGRDDRQKVLKKAKDKTLGFVYYIQTELGYKNLGLADDEFPSEDQLALVPYHREGRRLKGIERFTITNIIDRYNGKPLYRTGISVGDYPVDHHHDCNPDAPKIHFPHVPSFNIPLGALIPEKIDGLIVSDKAISVSNLINGATRLQPVVLLTGQAAGVLAALSIKNKKNIRDANIREVQKTLLDAGAYLMPLFDIGPEDPDFKPIQRVTSSGILKVTGESYQWANRTWFYPDTVLTVKEFSEGLNSFDKSLIVNDDMSLLTIKKSSELLSLMLKRNTLPEISSLLEKKRGNKTETDKPLTKRELAIIVDELVQPFNSRNIGFDGNYR
jgi:hypothetical protein